MPLTIYTHPSCLDHKTPDGHIERPARLQAVMDVLGEEPYNQIPQITANPASYEQVIRAHDRSYVLGLEERQPIDDAIIPLDGGDTYMSAGSFDAALLAAGAMIMAVDDVLNDQTDRAFCAVRPPGHHAEKAQSMGFCLFNTVFVGALHAKHAHNIDKVAIVDFDVHHGNASDSMSREHDGIFTISSHQYPLFPGTGSPETSVDESILNVALSEGTNSSEFRRIYEEQVFPALNAYKPNLVLISAGFDACENDPSAALNLQPEDFYWVTEKLCDIANTHAKGRLISTLEGGYNLDNLIACTSAHLNALNK